MAAGGETPQVGTAMQRWERELEEKNRPLSDEELDAMFPQEGYMILEPPGGYVPIRTPARKAASIDSFIGGSEGEDPSYEMPDAVSQDSIPMLAVAGDNLPDLKPDDVQYFGKLLDGQDDSALSTEELKERRILRLLLKIKNGTPPQRKVALRQITDHARDFGADALFKCILPMFTSETLEDQERHLLVKVIDRILYKLDELVRPHVHNILVVVEPMLIDEDYYARIEGREVVSNLAKAAGLAVMITHMRPDIDHRDEYVRNATARAFAVVASAVGIQPFLPFLKAVCQSKKSWQGRHTGIKIVQQIAILVGCSVLPHLNELVKIIADGINDENSKVRTITALSLAALAESAYPYGIESFDPVLMPLRSAIRRHRGKTLAAFLKAIGFIIPLMDAEFGSYYTKEIRQVLIREFATSDEEMKKIVLKVVKQVIGTDGVSVELVREEFLDPYFAHFWNRRMSGDRRNARQLIETTVALAEKVGGGEIVARIANDLKDENDLFRRMTSDTIRKIVESLGAADIIERTQDIVMDGFIFAFQEQTGEGSDAASGSAGSRGNAILNAFGVFVNAIGIRVKAYVPQISMNIKIRLKNRSPKVRQYAADLITKIATTLMEAEEEQVLLHMGLVLYENLGEEYPDVLGSILGALKAVLHVVGMARMTPPIKDLLPALTPILRNRHEKVQENCIDLVGRIADRGAEFVPRAEWIRICFLLLELLKAHKKAIRRASVNTFGYIAKAIGPHDVIATLLNNLKVQERQNRVCTTVAIAIVSETCGPFAVLPALMNEYRVPDLNVQHGVLKSMSFMFEYIGDMGTDYLYAVAPLLVDALMERDAVHRQIACNVVKHITLGAYGHGKEDVLIHLLNSVWPGILELSPHVINACRDAIEAIGLSVGPHVILAYLLQGLFHPAKKVRDAYWHVYNSLYIRAQEALVPFHPRLEDDIENSYLRTELEWCL
eukprot:TRINITY_DN11332_c0_g1_i1.p1 TRINITY_DN11332_c0_g1~~TRINITY_DN11332_c0_g1_i1.p1  ORF type:complete len:1120 (-),score=322.62 TRINITY_DN11332_c0_g1_i1:250-3105(-)